MQRAISVILVLCLLTTTTHAAPSTIAEVSVREYRSLQFWLRSSEGVRELRNLLTGQGRAPQRQETQEERNARVSRLQIFPGDVTIQQGQEVFFAAVGFDAEDNSVSGLKFNWSARDENRNQKAAMNPRGHFAGKAKGNFKVTVEAGGLSASVKVKVVDGRPSRKDEQPSETKSVSTRDNPAELALKQKSDNGKFADQVQAGRASKSNPRAKFAHATSANPAPYFLDDGWGTSNYWSADDPGNRRGDPSGGPVDSGAGSGNFQFVAPVLALPGRGIDLSLALTYNSRVWNKAGTNINYDIDRDWPAPGWSLGLGRILAMGVYNGGMLMDADGTRHSYSGTVQVFSWGTYFQGQTTDGTFIDYSYYSGAGGPITSAEARLPNGTVIYYYTQGTAAIYPSTILDPNGNGISITYVNNQGPRIQTITDTMGRVIVFHYDSAQRLTAITAPNLSSGTRTLVRLHYSQLALNYSFSGLTPIVRESNPWVIDAIYYPATNTGYWLSQSDNSYSTYGMLKKVSERRGMTFSGPAPVPPGQGSTEQGTITAGQVTLEEVYNYPLNTSDTTGTQASNLTDAPTYTSCTETWTRDGTNFDSSTTGYSAEPNANPRTVTVTFPNGTVSKQYSHNSPGSVLDGLVYMDETKSGSTVLQSTSTTWQSGAYNSPRPTTITKTNQLGQTSSTQFSYGSVYNQVTEIRNYDFGGALLHYNRFQYQNSSNYTNRHIFNLPLVAETFAPDGVTRLSRTEIQYDGQPLVDAPGVIMHSEYYNPYGPLYEQCACYEWDHWQIECLQWNCWYTSNYNPATDYRGNVTQVTKYANAAAMSGAITETKTYDITGNQVTGSSSCCQQTTTNYSVDTYYAYPASITRGSATDGYKQVTTSATVDFNTGLGLTATDENNATVTTTYDPITLHPIRVTQPTGAHTDYVYDETNLTTSRISYLDSHPTHSNVVDHTVSLLNGRGQSRQEQSLGAGGVWDLVDTIYDNMGRVSQVSAPYRSGDTIRWETTTYDALSRVSTSQAADGSLTQTFYNESTRPSVASSAPGETVRAVDAWGRERWARKDVGGRTVEVVEADPGGNGSVASNGLVTTYTHDASGNLVGVTQGSQTRAFKYDSLGRITAHRLAEASPTLNDAGTYVGAGSWTEVFTYDSQSNITSRTDARGVKTVFNYNSDPLNRVQSISFDTSGFGDSANPILSAPSITYQYRTKSSPSERKDVTQLSGIVTSGVSTESYTFDSIGRATSRTFTLNSRPSHPFVTDYIYDAFDRTTDVRYPAEYGNGSQLRRYVHQNYDVASRPSSLTVDGQSHASNIVYNAASKTTSLKVGLSGANQITENYSYNSVTGLLENQTVVRGASTTLMNLSYGYANSNGKRTGQLVSITNNLDNTKNRGYEYDSLGRLKRATGGQNVIWAQSYEYDRYGNRRNAFSFTAEQYIKNFYQNGLNRQPTPTELSNWLSTLQSAYAQGPTQYLAAMQSLGQSIFNSQEYANRNRTDHWFVYDLYKTYLYREPDASGWAFWESMVPVNGRSNIRNAFDWAPEFSLKVNAISPYSPAGGAIVPPDGVQGFDFNAANNRISTSGWNYDASGNQTRVHNGVAWQRYQYDAANRLVKIKADDNVTVLVSYLYGSNNQRLMTEESVSGTTLRTYFAADDGTVLGEYTELNSSTTPVWSKSYIHLGGRLLSTLTTSGVEYHHPDRLGTRVVTNGQNTSSFEQVTLPFGGVLNSESTGATNRRFTSYERHAPTGLDYAVNRHYDPQQGRFTQVDPIGVNAVDFLNPQTWNLYAYCTNDPVNAIDPSGLGLISFLKKIGRAIAKILTNKWVLLTVGIILGVLAGVGFYWAFTDVIVGTAVNTAYLYPAIFVAATSALLIVGAAHQGLIRALRIAGSIASVVQGVAGLINSTINGGLAGTPPWNPHGTGAISRFAGNVDCPDCVDIGGCGGSEANPCRIFGGTARAFPKWIGKWIVPAKNFFAGAVDAMTPWNRYIRTAIFGGGEENTSEYKAGDATVFIAGIFVPGGGAVGALAKGARFFKGFKTGLNPTTRMIGGKFIEFAITVPGRNGYTRWVKVVNLRGRTIKLYHDTYDAAQRFMHRGIKVPGPERHVP